jgi:hypothetical protein
MPETSNADKNDITALSREFEFEALPPQPEPEPDYGRKIRRLAAAIIVAVMAYSAGWFWVATALEDKVRSQTTKGVVFCTDMATHGYPFRIGVSCSKAAYAAPGGTLTIEALNLRTAAQIYAPGHFIGEIGAPLTVSLKDQPGLTLMFETARASVRGTGGLPQRLSLNIETLNLAQTATPASKLASAKMAAFHMRQGEQNQIDLALSVEETQVKDAPVFTLEADAALAGATRFDAAIKAQHAIIDLLRGNSGELRKANLLFAGGGSITISGPVSVSSTGLLSGTLALKIDKANDFIDDFSKLSAAFGFELLQLSTLKAMAVNDQINLTVTIIDGRASIGLIPIGQIPAF